MAKPKTDECINIYNEKFETGFTGHAYFIRLRDQLTWYQFREDIVNPLIREHIYPTLSMSQIREISAYAKDMATPLPDAKRYIGINERVWDTQIADYTTDYPHSPLYYIPYEPAPDKGADEYLLQIANNDKLRKKDILQTVAPIFLQTRPVGVIWWQGRAANGKSAFMNAIYKLFPSTTSRQLVSVGLDKFEDKRDLVQLNGALANVVRESPDAMYIKDGFVYKALGSHESFNTHRFYSQDGVDIDADLHHIFNTNVMPMFADKGEAIGRRTIMVKFENKFAPDPSFEKRTFTYAFLGGLLYRFLEAAQQLHANGHQYQFSPQTLKHTQDYRESANSAVNFVRHMLDLNVQFFLGMNHIRREYENYCEFNGIVPLGKGHLAHAIEDTGGFYKSTTTQGGKTVHLFKRGDAQMEKCDVMAPGIFYKPKKRSALDPTPVQNPLGMW